MKAKVLNFSIIQINGKYYYLTTTAILHLRNLLSKHSTDTFELDNKSIPDYDVVLTKEYEASWRVSDTNRSVTICDEQLQEIFPNIGNKLWVKAIPNENDIQTTSVDTE